MKKRECRRCEIEKDLDQFPKHGQSKDGRSRLCKICLADDTRAYAAANKEKINRRAREYYNDNKEAIAVRRNAKKEERKAYYKGYYKDNKVRLNEKTKKNRAANPEHYKAYRDANKERTKAYQLANKDRIEENRIKRKPQTKIYDRERYQRKKAEKQRIRDEFAEKD